MFHFPKDNNTNPTFQAVSRNRLKQDYCYLFYLIRQLGPHLDKLTRKGLAIYMALFYIVNPKRKKAIRPAKTQRDRDIQHKAVHLKRTPAQIKQEYPKLSLSSIYRILRKDCECVGRGPGSRWVYADKLRARRAKREIREQRKAYRRKNKPRFPYVALPRGRPIDKATLRMLLDDPLIFVLPKRKGRAPKNGTVSVASIARGAVRTSAKGNNSVPVTSAMRSLFLDYEVRADLVNGYPVVWKNGMHVFFHEFNWLRAQGLWAKPYDGERTHIHHVNGDRLDCRPRNLVLLTGRQHMALESDKRRRKARKKARRMARQGSALQRRK